MEARACAQPFQRGVVFPQGRDAEGNIAWTQLSFQDLNILADDYARGFQALGIQRGDRVSLLVKPRLEFIPLTFALFKLGAVPVLIDPGMGRKPFLACLQRIKPRVLIAEPIVQALTLFFPRAFASLKIKVTVGRNIGWWGGKSLSSCRLKAKIPFPTVHTAREDEAAILFTSGSTGPAKGVTYTHGIFEAQTRHIQAMYQIQPGEIDLACFPLFGLFSMAMGMTVIIPEMDPTKPAQADPAKLIEAIQSQGCTSAFGSPAIWKNMARRCLAERIKLPSMKRILMAGAPIPVSMHEAFQEILAEGAELHSPYGATEALPIASIASQEILSETQAASRRGEGTCVGLPAPGVEIRVIKISDEPILEWSEDLQLPQGEIGEICVRGAVVTHEYKEEPEHTAAAKIQDCNGGFWHRMGDLGHLDEEGRLWFCGRKGHRVRRAADDVEMYSVPCEAIFNEHPAVYRSALVGVEGRALIVVELEPDIESLQAQLREELLALGAANPLTESIKEILFHPSFPVDVRHNAKIHRAELARWAQRQI